MCICVRVPMCMCESPQALVHTGESEWGQGHGDMKSCISLFKLQSGLPLNYTGVSYQKLFPIL